MSRIYFGSAFLIALVNVSLPLHAEQGSVSLKVCNAGAVGIDVFISQSGKVSSSHIDPGDCAVVSTSAGAMAPAYVAIAFADSKGQWGVARRQDLLPDFGQNSGRDVLTRADQRVSVQHGTTTVSLSMQLLFQPPAPEFLTTQAPSSTAVSRLRINATASQRLDAQLQDQTADARRPADPGWETLQYTLNVLVYPDTREITFRKFCGACDKKAEASMSAEERAAQKLRADAVNREIAQLDAFGKVMGNLVDQANQQIEDEGRERQDELEPPQRVNWKDLNGYRSYALRRDSGQDHLNKHIVIRGTVSRVDASPPWVDIFFRESPEEIFEVRSSSQDIFEEMFGSQFRSTMIGKTLDVEGEVYRIPRVIGERQKDAIRVSLAHQVRATTGTDLTATERAAEEEVHRKIEDLERKGSMEAARQQAARDLRLEELRKDDEFTKRETAVINHAYEVRNAYAELCMKRQRVHSDAVVPPEVDRAYRLLGGNSTAWRIDEREENLKVIEANLPVVEKYLSSVKASEASSGSGPQPPGPKGGVSSPSATIPPTVTPAPVIPPVSAPVPPSTPGQPPDALSRQIEVTNRFRSVMKRAGQARDDLAQWQNQQAGSGGKSGGKLPPALRAASDRLAAKQLTASAAFNQHDFEKADQDLSAVEAMVPELENFLSGQNFSRDKATVSDAPPAPSPMAVNKTEFDHRYRSVMSRAQQAGYGLYIWQREHKQSGTQPPGDVTDARDRMEAQRKAAAKAFNANDISAAEKALQSIEEAAAVLEKFLQK